MSNNNRRDNDLDDGLDDLDWKSLNENEHDISDLKYKLNEISAAQKSIPYEFNGKEVKFSKETMMKLKCILEKARKQHKILTTHIAELSR